MKKTTRTILIVLAIIVVLGIAAIQIFSAEGGAWVGGMTFSASTTNETTGTDGAPTPAICGDGTCQAGESCTSDCGAAPFCGDGVCNGDETPMCGDCSASN